MQKYKVHYKRFEVAGEQVSDQEKAIELSIGKTKIEQNRRLSVTLSALHPASRYAIQVSCCTLGGCREGKKDEVFSEATLEKGMSLKSDWKYGSVLERVVAAAAVSMVVVAIVVVFVSLILLWFTKIGRVEQKCVFSPDCWAEID